MGIRVERYTASYVDAVRAFNGRLTARRAVPGFLLDETAPRGDDRPPLQREHFLAVETGGDVRGGFMLQRQTFAIGGRLASVVNYQAPISEGIADRRYAYLGMLMVKEALRHDPLLFCLGMGSVAQPLPRLLAALGFSVRPVPFLVRVHRASRVLRMLPMLRADRRRGRLADLLAATGAGWLAFRGFARVADLRSRPSALESERVDGWDGWVDALWERTRGTCAMVAVRDAAALRALYPRSDARNICLRVSQAGRPVGWAVLFDTAMRGSPHFGDLRVGTVLDCWALPGCEPAVIRAATRALESRGVDLVITNQSHAAWVAAFRRAGYLSGPSNYILAMSPALTSAVRAEPDGETRMHLTRGDADGRIHL